MSFLIMQSICERPFDEHLIEDIRKGREQAASFELPEEFIFSYHLMTTLYLGNDEKTLRPFRVLKYVH